MSEKECKEVINVLNMYRCITDTYNLIKDQTDLSVDDVKFSGYDGNNEGKPFSYANYLIIGRGQFVELKCYAADDEFNSHCPMIPFYKRMLDIWEKYPKKSCLTEKQIKKLLSPNSP